AGAAVRLYTVAGCGGEVAGSGAAGSAGDFHVGVNVVPNTTTTLYGTAQDAAGNVSPCSAMGLAFAHSATPPPTPTFAGTLPTTPTLAGSAEAGATVRLYTQSACTGAVAGTGSAAGGVFAIGVNVAPNASTTFYAAAQDAAGNTSSCSAGITYVHDAAAPAAP